MVQYLQINQCDTPYQQKKRQKTTWIISIDAGKTSNETQYLLIIKTLAKLGIERKCHNVIKAIYDKFTANII